MLKRTYTGLFVTLKRHHRKFPSLSPRFLPQRGCNLYEGKTHIYLKLQNKYNLILNTPN